MWPALGDANRMNDFRDAQYLTLFEEAARQAVARFHQLPLWDPYYCGGVPGFGSPQARFASPTFLLTLLTGTLRGAVLAWLLMTVVGLEGTFRYVRARGGGNLAAIAVAPVFALGGVFARSITLGWTNFFSFELVPWALFGVRLALDGSRRGVVIAALAVGWMIGFGGTYTAPLTLLAALFEIATLLATRARRPGRATRLGRVAAMGTLVVLLAVAVSMVRLWPVAETLASSPRILGGTPKMEPMKVWHFLFGEWGKDTSRNDDFRIGLAALPLVLLGVWRRRSIPFVVAAVVGTWLSLGYYKERFSLFAILRTIPPYTMLRAPERFLILVGLAAAVLAALAVRKIEAGGRRRRWLVVAAIGCQALLGFNTAHLVHNVQLKSRVRTMVGSPPIAQREFRQMRGNRWIAAYFPYVSRGSLTCFDDYNVAQSTELRGDLPQEEYLKDADAGTVRRVSWSPDRIDLQVDLTRPARVYVNQNWHAGWHSSVGAVVSESGLLAVDLDAGSHALTLEFRPRSALAGLGTTLLGLVVAGVVAWRARRKDTVPSRREWLLTFALMLAPFLVVALSFKLMREPRPPPLPLLTPSGEPMIVDAPPEDTTPIGARWAEGIVLEAARVELEPRDDAHGPLANVELDWRFDRPVPPGIGVFIQFEKTEKKTTFFATDHVLLSNALWPEDAPLHKTLRDVFDPVDIPEAKTAITWKVYAGLWRARRDMTRLTVTDPGTSSISYDRVLVGSFVLTPP
jgi:hypothetical protein